MVGFLIFFTSNFGHVHWNIDGNRTLVIFELAKILLVSNLS